MNVFSRNTIDLLLEFIKTNFKMRYQNSVLGILWVLIKPYSTFLVLFFIWSSLGLQKIENYPVYLLVGIVTFTFFNEMVIFGQHALLDRAGIILKVNFPRQIAVISSLSNAVINLGINFVLVVIIALLRGINITIGGILIYVFIALIFFLFSLGFSFITSVITIRLRDMTNIMELGLFLLYWATPIFYSVDASGGPLSNTAQLIQANPVGILLNQARAALGVTGELNLGLLAAYFAVSLLFCILGWMYFNNHVKKIAEYF